MQPTLPKRFRVAVLVFIPILLLLYLGQGLLTRSNNQVKTVEASTALQESGIPSGASFQNCDNTSVGLVPLIDLDRGVYQGFRGGLYLRGNTMPSNHLQRGLNASQIIERLNQQGQPDETGKIVLLSLGMSNTKQYFAKFMRIANSQVNRDVVLMNGAQGSYDAPAIANAASDYWPMIESRLAARDLSPLQVQAIWINEAVAYETAPFPQDAQALQGYLRDIVLIVEDRFPNVQTIYFSSRVYGGYAVDSSPSPEAWAYQSGFAVKWLIESQIRGSDPDLAYDNTPWLAWGPYTWADGLHTRSDGLTWSCDDFDIDGTHPSSAGELKVADMLLDFFVNDPTTQWFLDSQ